MSWCATKRASVNARSDANGAWISRAATEARQAQAAPNTDAANERTKGTGRGLLGPRALSSTGARTKQSAPCKADAAIAKEAAIQSPTGAKGCHVAGATPEGT